MRLIIMLKFLIWHQVCIAQFYTTINGHVDFLSDAPLEIIKASSEQLQGVLDREKNTFAFKMFVKSFEGFNSPLQQVHFCENYMEVNEYPIGTFKGKILEEIDPLRRRYRAKGILEIHGAQIERIIDIQMNIGNDEIKFNSDFEIPLVNHNIDLPRIVYQKIAELIKVNVNGILKIKK